MNHGFEVGLLTALTAVLSLSACSPPQAPELVDPAWLHRDTTPSVDCDPHEVLFPTVDQSRFGGVIVPKEYLEGVVTSVGSSSKFFGYNIDSFWTPSSQEVLIAEVRISADMLAAVSNPRAVLGRAKLDTDRQQYERREIEKIVAHLDSYDAQYAGIVVEGRKRILCNFMCRDERILGNSRMCHWVQVSDGGFWFWQIQYDIESGKCLGFDSNGYA